MKRGMYTLFIAVWILLAGATSNGSANEQGRSISNIHINDQSVWPDGTDHDVTLSVESEVNLRVPSFNDSLKLEKQNGVIEGCYILIDLPAPSVMGDHSYGGYCKLKLAPHTKKLVKICNDNMVGHFAIEDAEALALWSVRSLAEFVAHHCVGG